jgi:hypothetical protein
MATKKQDKATRGTIKRDFDRVEKLFRQLEKDKTLPTFGDHFMRCLILGTAEKVNLKTMYPKTYFKLSKWLDHHNKGIIELHQATVKKG